VINSLELFGIYRRQENGSLLILEIRKWMCGRNWKGFTLLLLVKIK
jgi:hypothetical protein